MVTSPTTLIGRTLEDKKPRAKKGFPPLKTEEGILLVFRVGKIVDPRAKGNVKSLERRYKPGQSVRISPGKREKRIDTIESRGETRKDRNDMREWRDVRGITGGSRFLSTQWPMPKRNNRPRSTGANNGGEEDLSKPPRILTAVAPRCQNLPRIDLSRTLCGWCTTKPALVERDPVIQRQKTRSWQPEV